MEKQVFEYVVIHIITKQTLPQIILLEYITR